MRNVIKKSKIEAIAWAHAILRSELKTNRLVNIITSNTSCQCDCGETQAVRLLAGKFTNQKTATVGYCKTCGEK